MNLNFNLLLLISEFITLVSLEAFFPPGMALRAGECSLII